MFRGEPALITSMVFTFIGVDKPGLIEDVSNTVSQHGGNWLESRMSQLAGQFAGIARIEVNRDSAETLRRALEGLGDRGLRVIVAEQIERREPHHNLFQLSLLGNDRPGIIRELTQAMAQQQINVGEMNTRLTSAPMTAESLFEATATIEVPSGIDLAALSDQLDEIANQLTVEIAIEELG